MYSRAVRRHHLERMKSKARKVYWFNSNPEKLANHLAACSCAMCGNPRKYFKEETRAEYKAKISSEEQEREM